MRSLSVGNTKVYSVMDGPDKNPVKYTEGVKEDSKAGEATSSVQGSGEGCGSCRERTRRLIPPEYRNELVQLLKLAGPVVRHSAVSRSPLLSFILYL